MKIDLEVNGRTVNVQARPGERLTDLLRDRLSLTGTKSGCDAGDCGACSVIINDDLCCACLVAAGQVAGARITTVEGIAADSRWQRLRDGFLRHGAAQCGICTPGMLVSAAALLQKISRPDRSTVEDALGGVLCRCTGYRAIVDATIEAGLDDAGHPATIETPGAGNAVGSAIPRLDGPAKVTGEEKFAADTVPADAALVRVIRSPHQAARFTIGDIDTFRRERPGIDAVLTAADIPGRNLFGAIPDFEDQPVLASGFTRFSGEAIAIVAGDQDAMAALDTDEFPVTWHPVTPLQTPEAAAAQDAPRIHAGRAGNVLVEGYVQTGDIELGFANAAHVVEGTFLTPFVEHASIEPEAGYALRRGDRIEIHACTQAPHMDRVATAQILGLDAEAVRIVPSACGGGFGSKIDLSLEPFIALAAWHLGRPAYIRYTRNESMRSTTKRHPAKIRARIGADAEGRLTAMTFDSIFNTGAYASWGPTVANRVPIHASGPYCIPNYRAHSRAVHTNGPIAGAFRGFGVPQSAIAQESLFHELALALEIDQLAFRIANALTDGMATPTGQVLEQGVGIRACFEALQPAWDRETAAAREFNARTPMSTVRRGVGIGSCWYGCGNTALANPSTIRIGLTATARVVLHQGATDIGQGSNTVIGQIAADGLGIKLGDLTMVGNDTDVTPDAGKTSASRQTVISGTAALRAARLLRTRILRQANAGEQATISFTPGALVIHEDGRMRTVDLGGLEENERGYVLEAEDTYDPPTVPLDTNGQGIPYSVYGYGAQIAALTVDMELGTVKLDRIIAAHDVGHAINPVLVIGQLHGGIAQGIGLALMEEYVDGKTGNLHDYLIPTAGDVPEIETVIVEVPDPAGPLGAKGLGEHALIPTAPAILNAIRDAAGVRINRLPATPDRVRAAIKERSGIHG